MPRRPHSVRRDFEEAVLAAIEKYGEGFDRAPLIQAAQDAGASRATTYRWLATVLECRRVTRDQALAGPLPPAIGTEDLPPLVELDVRPTAPLPAVPPPPPRAALLGGEVSSPSWSHILVTLGQCEAAAREMMASARGPDGRVRNSRLLLQASDHLRRTLETAARFAEVIAERRDADHFREALLSAISELEPGLRERVLRRVLETGDGYFGAGGVAQPEG